MSLDEMTIKDDANNASTAVAVKEPSALQQQNSAFDGIGEGAFSARVVLDGNQLLYKDENRTVDSISVQLTGGRKVHQFFDEPANTYHKSYDGKFTEEGAPVSDFPGMRHMFELDWLELIDDEEKEHQLVLSPTGRYSFEDFAKKLAKLKKSVADVTTIITATRQQNKEGQRYSRPEFTCQELIDAGK